MSIKAGSVIKLKTLVTWFRAKILVNAIHWPMKSVDKVTLYALYNVNAFNWCSVICIQMDGSDFSEASWLSDSWALAVRRRLTCQQQKQIVGSLTVIILSLANKIGSRWMQSQTPEKDNQRNILIFKGGLFCLFRIGACVCSSMFILQDSHVDLCLHYLSANCKILIKPIPGRESGRNQFEKKLCNFLVQRLIMCDVNNWTNRFALVECAVHCVLKSWLWPLAVQVKLWWK